MNIDHMYNNKTIDEIKLELANIDYYSLTIKDLTRLQAMLFYTVGKYESNLKLMTKPIIISKYGVQVVDLDTDEIDIDAERIIRISLPIVNSILHYRLTKLRGTEAEP